MGEIRPCIACGQRDDHPRDIIDLPDGSTGYVHHDCHAMFDPPCLSCQWLVQHKGELRGQAWREQVVSLHQELSREDLALHPMDREPVASHLNGEKL